MHTVHGTHVAFAKKYLHEVCKSGGGGGGGGGRRKKERKKERDSDFGVSEVKISALRY